MNGTGLFAPSVALEAGRSQTVTLYISHYYYLARHLVGNTF